VLRQEREASRRQSRLAQSQVDTERFREAKELSDWHQRQKKTREKLEEEQQRNERREWYASLRQAKAAERDLETRERRYATRTVVSFVPP
jgi:hypothetical protein